jgi:type IV secretion system protein VirB10
MHGNLNAMSKEPASQKTTQTSSFTHWSQVSKRVKNNRRPLFLLMILCLAFLIFLWPKRKPSASESNITKVESATQEDYRNALNENLVYLQSRGGIKKEALSTPQPKQNESKFDKNYLARQNAPTGMYSPAFFLKNPGLSQSKHTDPGTVKQSPVEAKSLSHPDFTLAAGEFLQAVLETAIDSDFPGPVRAIVSKPVYAYTGTQALIPAGSRLQGHYASAVLHGQNRVMIYWDRILLPTGLLVKIDSPSTDALGRVGQGADQLSTHFVSRFGQATLLSLIGAGAAQTGPHSYLTPANAADQYRAAMAQSFQQSAQQSLQETQARQATLHVYQGTALQVFVTQDVNFYPALHDTLARDFS